MKNEALRLFLAVAALIITAMITNTSGTLGETPAQQRNIAGQTSESGSASGDLNETTQKKSNSEATKNKSPKKSKKTVVVKTVHKANRSFAFFFRR